VGGLQPDCFRGRGGGAAANARASGCGAAGLRQRPSSGRRGRRRGPRPALAAVFGTAPVDRAHGRPVVLAEGTALRLGPAAGSLLGLGRRHHSKPLALRLGRPIAGMGKGRGDGAEARAGVTGRCCAGEAGFGGGVKVSSDEELGTQPVR